MFLRPTPRLFSRPNVFETDTDTFFENKFFETDTETFFRPNFSKPSLKLFSRQFFFETETFFETDTETFLNMTSNLDLFHPENFHL